MMKKYSRFFSLILALTMFICLCTAARADDDAVRFTDALGREVCLSEKPERVAALIGSFAEIWLLSGGDICATAEDAWDDFGLELSGAINIGGAHSPNLELLLTSEPDFIIASASTLSNVELREIIEAAGIQLAYFDVDNFYDYLEMLDICTDITGRKDLFEQNGLALQAEIENIKCELAGAGLSDRERTVLLLRASSGFVKAKGSEGTILGEMLADLGCINIADSDTRLLESLGTESIIRQNPHRIFVVTMGDDTQKAMDNLQILMDENPAWSALDAVAEGRLHVMERKLFNIKPNARWAESYEKLSRILLDKQ